MSLVQIDFNKTNGAVKPMHAVNNGPAGSKVRAALNNFKAFEEAGIPYVRNHDASFYTNYGGEHTVDIHRIFKNFDADENLPESYNFESTDRYLNDIEAVNSKVFYRLGASIEHDQKCGTIPPKDFNKWARICEHIIRHYTEGWADGFKMDIEYWEIWNEPDCMNADGSNPCWQGEYDEFIEMFVITFKHLKSCFPHLKIGGPAFTNPWAEKHYVPLFERLVKENITLDFYSFHGYMHDPFEYADAAYKGYETLKEYGYEGKTELILNEWNYVKGWLNDDFEFSIRAIKSLMGASFTLGSMCSAQYSPLDMFMYYDARPCGFNGMFDTTFVSETLKGYYPFPMFNELYKLGTSVEVSSDNKNVYACAAKNDNEAAFVLTYYEEDNSPKEQTVTVDISNLVGENGVEAEYYLLDETHDMELVRAETFTADKFKCIVKLPLYTCVLVKLKKI